MKPSESLRLAGRPVAYFPQLAEPLGSVNASVLFSHLFYWHDKASNPLGIYRTAEEIKEETGLSVQEQRTARAKLRERGILIETEKRIEHRIYYRLDMDAFDRFMLALSAQKSSNIPEVQNQHSGNAESTFADGEINIRGVQNQQPYKEQKITTVDYNNNNNNNNSARAFADSDSGFAETADRSFEPAEAADGIPTEQPMTADWLPENEQALAANLRMAGLPEPSSEAYGEGLAEFRLFWLTRSDCFTPAVWQHKFLQSLMTRKVRGLGRGLPAERGGLTPDALTGAGFAGGSTPAPNGSTPLEAGLAPSQPSKGFQALAAVEAEKRARLEGKPGLMPAPLFAELAGGLQTLLALNLPGRPAADSVAATLAMWEKTLCGGRTWTADDAGRLQTAFETLAAGCTQFPAPAELIPRLPPRLERLKLEKRQTPEEWAQKRETAKTELAALSDVLKRKAGDG